MKKISVILICALLCTCVMLSGCDAFKSEAQEEYTVNYDPSELTSQAQTDPGETAVQPKNEPVEQQELTASEKAIYKKAFDEDFHPEDRVCFIDLTHDGKAEMVAFDATSDLNLNSFYVYTLNGESAQRIYEQADDGLQHNMYFTGFSGEANIVEKFDAVFADGGRYSVEEFYLNNSGDHMDVSKIAVDFGGDPEKRASLEGTPEYAPYIEEVNGKANAELDSQITAKYGKDFSNVYKIGDLFNGANLYVNTNSAVAFGE